MRAKHNNILVKADLEQKESHKIKCDDGREITLYIGRNYAVNKREANPCVCEVIDCNAPQYPHINAGDILVVHHNMLVKESPYLIDIDGTEAIFSFPVMQKEVDNQTKEVTEVPNRQLFAKLVDGELYPICNNLICERIKMPSRSSIIIDPDPPEYEDRVMVLKVSPEIYGINPGDVVLKHKLGDYDIVYNWNGREARATKVYAEDVYGIIEENQIA